MPTLTWWILIDLAIAAGSLWFGVKVFLFVFFCYYVWTSLKNYNSLRALARTYQVSNEVAMLAIKKQLGITADHIDAAREEYVRGLTDTQRESVERDFYAASNGEVNL